MVDKSDMGLRGAGHKGGEKAAMPHGDDFYQEIGHKGGEAGITKAVEAETRKK
ncbi:MAG TPA: hypothetical protein VGK13_01305 [Methanocellaceae archaeon]